MKSVFWCCFDIIFHILHVLWKKPHQQNGGGNLLFLHQRRRPRQTASKEAVEKNVGDLNETLKLLPRIVCLCGFFFTFFLIMSGWRGVWKFTGCFVFMIALGRQLDCESVSLHLFYIDPHVSCRLKEIQYTVYYFGKSHITIWCGKELFVKIQLLFVAKDREKVPWIYRT